MQNKTAILSLLKEYERTLDLANKALSSAYRQSVRGEVSPMYVDAITQQIEVSKTVKKTLEWVLSGDESWDDVFEGFGDDDCSELQEYLRENYSVPSKL